MRYDIDFVNPLGNPGTQYAVEADSAEEAAAMSPCMLAASSQWRPDQFRVAAVRESICKEEE